MYAATTGNDQNFDTWLENPLVSYELFLASSRKKNKVWQNNFPYNNCSTLTLAVNKGQKVAWIRYRPELSHFALWYVPYTKILLMVYSAPLAYI